MLISPVMRAAVVFGLGSFEKDLRPFQKDSTDQWQIGLPASSQETDAILLFGGDGTVHRHLAELVKLQLPVLVVPCGSGNDFARALGMPTSRHALAAWQDFRAGNKNVRVIDLGVITPREAEPSTTREHYFCCVGGIGLDAEVARRANQLPRWLRGHGGYAASLLPTLFSFAPLAIKLGLPSGHDPTSFAVHSQGPVVLAAFANGPTYGGGMKIAPRARMDDGQLDVCLVHEINPFKLFCLFPTVYFGRHLGISGVEYFQAHSLRLETEHPLDVYADGEYVCQTPIDVSVARAALRVIVQPSLTGF